MAVLCQNGSLNSYTQYSVPEWLDVATYACMYVYGPEWLSIAT